MQVPLSRKEWVKWIRVESCSKCGRHVNKELHLRSERIEPFVPTAPPTYERAIRSSPGDFVRAGAFQGANQTREIDRLDGWLLRVLRGGRTCFQPRQLADGFWCHCSRDDGYPGLLRA